MKEIYYQVSLYKRIILLKFIYYFKNNRDDRFSGEYLVICQYFANISMNENYMEPDYFEKINAEYIFSLKDTFFT